MAFFGNTGTNAAPVQKKLANISEDAINSNQQAVPVTYLAGRQYITGNYISPAYNPRAVPIHTQQGKGTAQTTGYKYFADFALVFCMGGRRPVDTVYKVIVDSDIAWSGNITRGNAEREVITVPNYGTIYLYWGSETQPIDSILLQARGTAGGGINPQDSTTWPANQGPNQFQGFAAGDQNPYSGHYDIHPAYRGQCYAVFKDWKLGRDRTSIPNIALELKRGSPWIGGAFIDADDLGLNPVVVLYDWLTDTRFGMGLPETSLNTASFQSLYTALETKGARLAPVITQQNSFRQVVATLLEYYDGWIRRNGTQLEVGMWAHGPVIIPNIAILTDDDLLGEPELEPGGWGPTMNEVTVVYSDRNHHYNEYIQTHRDPNNFRITGSPRPIVLQRDWLTDAALAKQYAREYGAIQALPTTQGLLHVKREWIDAHGILPGTVFLYNSGFYGLSFYLRLLDIEHETDSSAKATLTVEWERAFWPSLFIPQPFGGPGGFQLGPRPIWIARISEVPYIMLSNQPGFLTQVVALAIKGNIEVVGFRVWASFDGGATYQDLANSNNFGAFGLLAGGIGPAAPGFWAYAYGPNLDEVLISQQPPQQNNDDVLCFIDAEVMSVGAVVAYGQGLYYFNILRHRFGTAAQNHAFHAQAYFIRRDHLRLMDNAGFVPGQQVLFKLQPFTHENDYDLSTITPITYTISGWAPIDPPVLSPPGGTFVGSVTIQASAAAGMTIRYTADGTPVFSDSARWPAGGLTLSASAGLRVACFSDDGRRSSGDRVAIYTKVAQGAGGPNQCAPPGASFSGIHSHTAGDLTLTPTTVGSSIKFSLNGGPIQNYASPVHLACNDAGDICEYWAVMPGLDDSPHIFFDNTLDTPGGGGYGGSGGHRPP